MVKVLVDSSFLMHVASNPSDEGKLKNALGKLEFIVLNQVVEELKCVSEKKALKKARQAKLALEYACGLPKMESAVSGSVDKVIVETAYERRIIVATLDRSLRRELKRKKIPVIYRRGRMLCLEGSL